MKVTITRGNTKLGKVYNISLPPGTSCPKDAPCLGTCYAMKAWRQYPASRKAWQGNYDAWKEDSLKYFGEVARLCSSKQAERFRWHVAGDIPNLAYYKGMVMVAECNPTTQFLAFTKNVSVANEPRPENLRIIISMWPKLFGGDSTDKDITLQNLKNHCGIAWMDPIDHSTSEDLWYTDKITNEVVKESVECSGNCDECFLCWYLDSGSSVVFKQH
jgi:hypothetical protein